MELLVTINGEVKEFGRRSFIEENVRNLSINEMKVSFIQGLVNLMTLNLKKITLFTLIPQNLKKFKSVL